MFRSHPLLKGVGFMLLASLLFSGMGALMKFCTARLPVVEVVFARTALSLPLLLPWLRFRREPFVIQRKGILLLRSISGFTALMLSVYATSQLKLADAAILNLSSTVFVAIISALVLKENIGWRGFAYILLALLGAALIIKPTGHILLVPGVAGLCSGVFAAIAYIAIKSSLKTESVYNNVLSFTLFSAIAALPFAPLFIAPTSVEWLGLIGIGTLGTFAQLSMTRAYRYGPASVISPFSYSGVIFSASWGALFWGEWFDHWSLVGTGLIIGCGIGIMRLKKSRGDSPP